MTRVSSTQNAVHKSTVTKKTLKKKHESKKPKKSTKAQAKSLEAKNDELVIVFHALQDRFDTLFPQLCKHDQISAQLLWARALSTSDDDSTFVFPPICGCNEN